MKTLGSILAIAGAAVLVATGIGAAGGLALFGATAGITVGGLSLGTLAIISSSLTAIGALATRLGEKSPKPEAAATSVKSPTPARVSGYGRSRIFGSYALYMTSSDGAACDAYAINDGRIDGYEAYYLADKLVSHSTGWVPGAPDGLYRSPTVFIDTRLGLPVETAFSRLISKLPGIWTSNHRGDGVATAMVTFNPVKAKDFTKIYPNGTTAFSAVGRWQLVFDWRDETQSVSDPATWKWSENTVLQLAHYELVRHSKDWSVHFAPTLSYWTAAADHCDEPVALKNGGTEPRYRSCIAHKHTDAHKGVVANLLAAFDGWMAPRSDGALIVYSGRLYEPTVTIGPDQIVSYSLQDGLAEEEAVNQIAVNYLSSANDYNYVDTDAWEDLSDIAARGKVLATTLENQVPSYSQARRLAKREMAHINASKRGTTTTNASGRSAVGQRYIRQILHDAGDTFLDAAVEITKLTRNLSTGGVTYDWILIDPNIDAWNPATEEGNPAPVGDVVAPEPLEPPTVNSAVFFGSDNSGAGTPGARIRITATGPDRADLTWFARWRVVGGASWNEQEYNDTDPGASVVLETGFVPVGADVEVQAAYQVGDGRISPYSDPPHEVDTGSITADSTSVTVDTIEITADRT